MAHDGISRLITVTQMKTENANQNAMDGADKQRDLVRKQQSLHAAQSRLNDIVHRANKDVGINAQDEQAIRNIMQSLGDAHIVSDTSVRDFHNHADGKLDDSGANGDAKDNSKAVDALKARLEGAAKDLEAQDKLGNFEINDLMSQYNQSETLASSVMKKRDDTGNAVIQKI